MKESGHECPFDFVADKAIAILLTLYSVLCAPTFKWAGFFDLIAGDLRVVSRWDFCHIASREFDYFRVLVNLFIK